MKSILDEKIPKLIGKICWACVSSDINGSMLNIHLGEKVARTNTIDNPYLPEELKAFRGEYGVFVQMCSWRTTEASKVTGTWRDSEQIMVPNVQKFVGLPITKVDISKNIPDITFEFGERYYLSLFCDANEFENYSVRFPDVNIVVGASFECRLEK